jgi:ParB family transcriptional regulator, chromosome partitioning protein
MSAREAGPRLGRGLAALLGDTAESEPASPSSGAQRVAVELLDSSPYQPRGPIDPDSLADLTDSIRVRGILQPLLVRRHPTTPHHYQIIAGERRWRAAKAAGLADVPILVRDFSDAEAMAAALVENLQREDLNPIEEAEGYRRLVEEFGLIQEALAGAVGKSRSHVANTLRLLNLPHSVQGEVRKGALSAGHARALLSHPEPEKAALAVISRGLNVRQTEALSAHPPQDASTPERQKRVRDPETDALERDLSERLGLRVEIAFNGKGGSVRVHYRSLDQLDAVIALLSGH